MTEEDVFPVEPAPYHCPIHDPVVAHSHRRSAKTRLYPITCRRLHRPFREVASAVREVASAVRDAYNSSLVVPLDSRR